MTTLYCIKHEEEVEMLEIERVNNCDGVDGVVDIFIKHQCPSCKLEVRVKTTL